jgi:hypothetical protein
MRIAASQNLSSGAHARDLLAPRHDGGRTQAGDRKRFKKPPTLATDKNLSTIQGGFAKVVLPRFVLPTSFCRLSAFYQAV